MANSNKGGASAPSTTADIDARLIVVLSDLATRCKGTRDGDYAAELLQRALEQSGREPVLRHAGIIYAVPAGRA